MNIKEAEQRNLIVLSSNDGGFTFNLNRWRLVTKVENGRRLTPTNEEFTAEEVQGLIDLLERVNIRMRR